MLVNLVPEFLATLSAADPSAAYHEYLDHHRLVLAAYWQNYVIDPESAHAESIIATALRADRSDLKRLLEDVDVVAIAEEALRRSTELLEADCPVDLYLMVGVGAANAGELVVGGRGEFTVWVNGKCVAQKDAGEFPEDQQVLSAVQTAIR